MGLADKADLSARLLLTESRQTDSNRDMKTRCINRQISNGLNFATLLLVVAIRIMGLARSQTSLFRAIILRLLLEHSCWNLLSNPISADPTHKTPFLVVSTVVPAKIFQCYSVRPVFYIHSFGNKGSCRIFGGWKRMGRRRGRGGGTPSANSSCCKFWQDSPTSEIVSGHFVFETLWWPFKKCWRWSKIDIQNSQS